jgi:hypothetical protein
MPRIFTSLIQSDFRSGDHANFEAVIQTGDTLQHWYRDNSAAPQWKPGPVFVRSGVAGAGGIIQSDFSSSGHGNFEVVVPMFGANGVDLVHWFHDNSDVTNPWQQAQTIASGIAGPGCIIQSDFTGGGHGNFEVVVPMYNSGGGVDLVHWFHDNSDVTKPWQQAQTIVEGVAGPGCIIQSDFTGGGHGNFEVVVPIDNGNGGLDLWHFFHDNSDVTKPWERGQRVAPSVAGPGCIIQSDFTGGSHGNFEVIVPMPRGDGWQLRHFFHDNSDVTSPWQEGQFITDSAAGWASLMSSDYYGGTHRNFEVLTEECSQSVVGYWHPNEDPGAPWLRNAVVLGEQYPVRIANTHRICQLTGEFDRTGWNGVGAPNYAHNRTGSAYQIRGTDLGVSFPHRGRTYLMFGDTFRDNQPDGWDALDLIAYTNDVNPVDGLDVAFFYQPPRISDGIAQGAFDVPLDGVSAGDHMYVFFSTDHVSYGSNEVMGRSVLTRCDDDGFAFAFIREFSRYKFVNVSIQRGSLDQGSAERIGLPAGTDVLWVWGSGRYRSSDVYLAVVPFAQLEPGPFDVRYFAGNRETPSWSANEEDATALFASGSVGELSVRWHASLSRYLATFNADNPGGINLHSAQTPWGPWTPAPLMLFDPGFLEDQSNPCSGDGYGSFLHIAWNVRVCDHVQDDMFGCPRDNDFGGVYGPYQLSNYTEAGNGGAQIFFTMSSWNPYQSHLMTAFIEPNLLA